MGWNDHVSSEEMECLSCGEIDTWTMWDDGGKARYTGRIGKMLGVDPAAGNRCPHCGSTRGKPAEDDEIPDIDGPGWRD